MSQTALEMDHGGMTAMMVEEMVDASVTATMIGGPVTLTEEVGVFFISLSNCFCTLTFLSS